MPFIQQKIVKSQVILYDAEHFSEPQPRQFEAEYWQAKQAIIGEATGRGTTYFFQYNNQEFVLRHYRRGGLIGKVLEDGYLNTGVERSRAWREFRLLQHMQNLGLPCPTPIAAMFSNYGVYYRADLISLKIAQARDLHQVLLKQPLENSLWQMIGQTIGQFHNQHIYHHDLNIHNIMLDAENKVWLIDFDKCAVRQGEKWKRENLARLKRSLEKELKLHHICWQATDWQALLNGYNNPEEMVTS